MAMLGRCIFKSTLAALLTLIVSIAGQGVEMNQFHETETHGNPSDIFKFGTNGDGNQPINYLQNVHWKNCNKSSVPIQLRNLTVEPYPIPINTEELWYLKNFSLDVMETIGDPENLIEVDLSFRMYIVDQWRELCDIIGEENCHMSDLCYKLKNLFRSKCVPFLTKQGFNCSCPIVKNDFNFPFLPIRPIILPFDMWGTFDATVVLRKQGRDIACIYVGFCIQRC